MDQNIKFLQSWIVFYVIVVFLSYLLNLVFTFPVGIILSFMGFSTKVTVWIAKIGTLLSSIAISYFFYKWSVITFILPQFSKGKIDETSDEPKAIGQ